MQRVMISGRRLWWLLVGAGLALSPPARAAVVERVVAVVEDQAILLSDLRRRAEPYLVRIHQQLPDGAQRAAATSQLYQQLLERMVDDELESRAAARAKIAVTQAEVDAAIERIAAQNGIPVERLLEEATRSGLTQEEYRREVYRQVLDAKMMNLRLQGRLRVTEDELRAAYQRQVLEERRTLRFEAAWITIAAPVGRDARLLRNRRELAETVAREARTGSDFAELARRYSSDKSTRQKGGRLGWLSVGQLPAVLDRALLPLAPGEVAGPIRVGNDLVVIKLLGREPSNLPSFEQARAELSEAVYVEKMNRVRRRWLDVLRRRAHVEIRL